MAQRRLSHMETDRSRSGLAIKQFSIKCPHTGTFPAVHSLQHPLVIAFVWGHPLSAHAVSGEIPVLLLLRGHCHSLSAHAIIILIIKYPWFWFGFPLDGDFCFFLLLSVPLALGSSQNMQSCGHNPLSTSQTYDFSPLSASQPPHSLIEFGSALLLPPFFFLSLFLFRPLTLFLS